MVVKFVPVGPSKDARPAKDRENLAEVIDLREKIAEVAAETPSTYTEVLTDATKILARKAMSSGELRAALNTREHDEYQIEEVLANFEKRNFLDDRSLAEAVSDKLRRTKQASKQHIQRQLSERMIPRDVIESVLSDFDAEEETDLLLDIARDRARRLGSLDRPTAERRLSGFLQRRGWGGPELTRVVRQALDEA